ncbi:MAG: hypothetical protein LBH65_01345 [Desulfovibrio sp.]|jgi:YbbR domain-containing protein|nr:hypothetical protein [Desulfovibrio sp.]
MKLRWKECVIAFLMAFVLWYGVTGSEKVESQVEVRVDYRGLPQGLVVRDGFINKISVRVRAPMAMLRSVSQRDYAFPLDLSGVHKGENTIPIHVSYLPFRSIVEVIDVMPSRIFLLVDTMTSKKVPLELFLLDPAPKDHTAKATFEPAEVTLSGPSGLLDDIDGVPVPISLEIPIIQGITESRRVLNVPDGIDASPSEVKVSLHVGIKRKEVKVTRSVQASAPSGLGKFVRPDKVTITLSLPESLAAKAASNADIKAVVDMPSTSLGSYTLPVRVTLPEHAELRSVDPPRVTVTLEQKQTAPAKKK